MIKYQLICDQNHEFEGWFQGSAAYDEQAANGILRCPLCDSDKVKRALMTPNLSSPKRQKLSDPSLVDPASLDSIAAVPDTPAPEISSLSLTDRAAVQGRDEVIQSEQFHGYVTALAELRQLRQKITKNCRNVGDRFAEEARKIHNGELEAEGIYGKATHEEREALKDEGIEIFDMPWLPSDH